MVIKTAWYCHVVLACDIGMWINQREKKNPDIDTQKSSQRKNKGNSKEKGWSFQQMVPVKLIIYMQKLNLDTNFTTLSKIKQNQTSGLNGKWKSTKLLEENIEGNINDLEISDVFLDKKCGL